MHQRLYRSREETVHDKEILFDAESWVQAFEIAGMVILNAMTQYQVLSTSGRTDWISLNKAESVESTFQGRGLEKTAGYGKAAQIVQRNQHDSKLASEASAVDAQRVEARKYPQVQPSRIGDKGIRVQDLPRE